MSILEQQRTRRRPAPAIVAGDPSWYKDAIIYQLHVRAFQDSNGDGIGDFRGLVRRLDYLQDLGITAIWLLPFYPSPLRDDGYDTANYMDVHPSYGTLRDFKLFLKEAHVRGLRVITELVLNHTSDTHPWFQKARRAKPGSPAREFYVWSDTPQLYEDARIIFKDFETSNWSWDPVANAYYWHRFYSHQPDLNWENPEVVKALHKTVDYWLEMGVDGLRLDAVPYLFEVDGTNCENLPATHQALKDLRTHIDANFADKMLLAEANQWPEDAVDYFGKGKGDECHMAFHFPLMPRMFMAIRMEDRFPIIDILAQTPAIPETAQWAIFLRNHDELTLEMVTDEERDYMYRVYAEDPQARINLGIRRRLAPLLGNDRRLIEMMNGLLMSLPGTPVVYYGDEIGMGDNIYLGDRHGVRTPMQWSTDRNAGFSDANPQRLYLPVVIDPGYGPEAINVEAQQNNPASLLWWMKRLVGLRKRYAAFGRGELEFLYPENRKVLTFLRRLGDEVILVVCNLSRYAQYVELDLSEFQGHQPVALLGGVEFPRIGELPYLLTLGPHDFYWFAIEPGRAPDAPSPGAPTLDVKGAWHEIFEDGATRLDAALPAYLRGRRWFGSKGRRIKGAAVSRVIPVPSGGPRSRPIGYLTLVDVEYGEGEGETYVLPIAWSLDDAQPEYLEATPIAHLRTADGEGFLHDAVFSPAFNTALLNAIQRRRRLQDGTAQVTGQSTPVLRRRNNGALDPSLLGAEQSNTSVQYGDALVLKLFRKLESGVNPDLEIGRFLTDRSTFEHTPKVAGGLEFRDDGEVSTLAILQEYVPNEGDAWTYTLDVLRRYFEDVLAMRDVEPTLPQKSLIELTDVECPQLASETIGPYLGNARLLGERTAEMHLALAGAPEDPDFAPEAFSALTQRALYQSLRTLARRVMQIVRRRAAESPELAAIAERENEILDTFRRVLDPKLDEARIRCHGDYHLGQVLWTGKDWVIIDFEGEPLRPISERRLKKSPLRDVAGMIRSFHYAAHTVLAAEVADHPEQAAVAEKWAQFWYLWVSATFLDAYLSVAGEADFVPENRDDFEVVLDVMLLEKALYELRYEANNRPEWIRIPALGITQLLDKRH